mgnify:FL=1
MEGKEKINAMKHTLLLSALLLLALGISPRAVGCTNFLFSKGSTTDGSTMITYAADSHTRYGQLRYHAASDHQPGEMVRLYDYGSLQYRLSIPQPAHTYRVVGFINEHQLAIGETTWGGRPELENGNANGIDYGNLIYLALQRARNAREAIVVMHQLVSQYGYASGGESFSIADPNEVWLYEIIDKGDEQGAVWVARRVPEGYVCGHANQARISTFPQEKKRSYASLSSLNLKHIMRPEVECVYSHDVITFARGKGWYSGKDEDFSFCDTYNPISFSGARACDARVWAMYRRVADSMDTYLDYALGHNLQHRLPLWVKPNHKIDVLEVMALMRDHYEGTPMDMTADKGAGPFHCPYRWRPMDFEVDGKKYVHERATSTQQTGFSFVAQCRSWLPNSVGGVLWFGVDDTYSSVYCPMLCGISRVPLCFEEGNGSMSQYSPTAAFWLFNRVANFCYSRYDAMIPHVQRCQQRLERHFVQRLDSLCTSLAEAPQPQAVDAFSLAMADEMMQAWKALDEFLLVKFIDGNVKPSEEQRVLTTPTGVVASPQHPAYPEWFYRMIVDDNGKTLIAQ